MNNRRVNSLVIRTLVSCRRLVRCRRQIRCINNGGLEQALGYDYRWLRLVFRSDNWLFVFFIRKKSSWRLMGKLLAFRSYFWVTFFLGRKNRACITSIQEVVDIVRWWGFVNFLPIRFLVCVDLFALEQIRMFYTVVQWTCKKKDLIKVNNNTISIEIYLTSCQNINLIFFGAKFYCSGLGSGFRFDLFIFYNRPRLVRVDHQKVLVCFILYNKQKSL